MFVNVINVDNVNAMDYALFPEQNPINNQYLQQQMSNFSNSLTDVGRKFMETSREIYEKFNGDNAMRMAKAAMRMVKGVFHPNTILELNDLEMIRSAQPIMQRYIMAQPYVRAIYHEQKCDGYSDTYRDMEPDKIGEEHYDYRRVMDGIVQETVVDGVESWKAVHYYDDMRGDDIKLKSFEQFAILGTWDVAELFMRKKQDSTNIFGGSIGA